MSVGHRRKVAVPLMVAKAIPTTSGPWWAGKSAACICGFSGQAVANLVHQGRQSVLSASDFVDDDHSAQARSPAAWNMRSVQSSIPVCALTTISAVSTPAKAAMAEPAKSGYPGVDQVQHDPTHCIPTMALCGNGRPFFQRDRITTVVAASTDAPSS